jgi:Ca-activated chloride channel homolog
LKSLVLAAATLTAAAFPAGQFRSGTNIVEIYSTVVDRNGRVVPDLTQDDFQVYDNGKLQKISVFDRGTQPITMAMLVDESPSVSQVSARIEAAVEEFAKHFLPGDRATIGAFSHIVRLEKKLSDKPAERLAEMFAGRPRFPSGTALWDAIDAGNDALKRESGRRVVLVLSDADDNCSVIEPAEVLSLLERDGTMVYAIGVKGNSGLPVRDLRTLTRDSGGYYFELRRDDDLPSTLARVADELHRQYLIGFTPAVLDGRAHELRVDTKRSGLTARARRSFVAAAGGVERGAPVPADGAPGLQTPGRR